MSRKKQRGLWENIREAFGDKPIDVDGQFNYAVSREWQHLLTIVKGRLEVTCPEWWDVDNLLDILLLQGRVFITDSAVGVAPFNGSAHGINVFNRSSYLTVTNSVLQTFDRVLTGTMVDRKPTAVNVYLYDNKGMRSIVPILDEYAYKLASCDRSLDVNLMNCNASIFFNCADNKQAEEAKLVYDKISRGEPAIFTKIRDITKPDDTGVEISHFPAKEMYIADKIVELKRNIMSDFLTLWGTDNIQYEKKERLVKDEVSSNNAEIEANISYMQDNLKRQSKLVRQVFGIDFNIKFKDVNKKYEDEETPENAENAD